MTDGAYILITPACNEAKYISMTINSVLAQTVKPQLWVIIDDGSTDETASVIRQYASEHSFIRYHYRSKSGKQAYYASNVHAIMEGYQLVRHLDVAYVAILDADITLPNTYYETILQHLGRDKRLGVASGIYENLINGRLKTVVHDRRSTPKAIMVFRREVFEQIGGFLALPHGGEDTAACIMARMRGWRTRSFFDVKVVHHRPTGLGTANSILKARFMQGKNEYWLGSHPLFALLKSMSRCIKEEPFVVGGLARFAGYISGYVDSSPRQVPQELVDYYRKEQLKRILCWNRVEC